MWKKEKMLVGSIFSFYHNVFYHSKNKIHFLMTLILLSADTLNLDQSKNLSFGKEWKKKLPMFPFNLESAVDFILEEFKLLWVTKSCVSPLFVGSMLSETNYTLGSCQWNFVRCINWAVMMFNITYDSLSYTTKSLQVYRGGSVARRLRCFNLNYKTVVLFPVCLADHVDKAT